MKKTFKINDTWYIRQIENTEHLSSEQVLEYGRPGSEELDCRLPAQVHEILLSHGRIDDPLAAGNSLKCKWVAEKDWIYRGVFTIEEKGEKNHLLFKGLDTVADIYLNGICIGCSSDMFIPNDIDVTDYLKEENTIIVHFHSPVRYIEGREYPAEWENKIGRHKLIRKMSGDFSDFLGPKPFLSNIGIFDDVLLVIKDEIEISYLDLNTVLRSFYKKGIVEFAADIAGDAENAVLDVSLRDPDGKVCAKISAPVCADAYGKYTAKGELSVCEPQLWWPRTHGSQPLYKIEASLIKGGVPKDSIIKNIGFRDLKMVAPFDFRINGKPVKLWGANLVPMKRITNCWDGAIAQRLLDITENAHMNTLRIWGQGVPYPDELYDEADKRGLLLWQEFYLCYGMQPDDRGFREMVKREVEFTVKRLKHRTCIFMWCGGNESPMGGEYDFPGEYTIGKEVYEEDIKEVCTRLDPGRFYLENSPYGGEFSNDPLAGDTHGYTHMWYVPGADYPIMLSENTRISTPSVRSMKRYLGNAEMWPKGFTGLVRSIKDCPLPDTWMEYAPNGVRERMRNIEKFYDADNPEDLAYKMGSAHALHLYETVERSRRGKPAHDAFGRRRCMGHTVWKLNEPWPAFYSSMVDYYLECFIPYYALRRANEPVLVSFDIGDHINIWVVNDTVKKVEGTILCKLYDPKSSTVVDEASKPVAVEPDESMLVLNLDAFRQFRRDYFLYACLTGKDGKVIARSNDFVNIERNLYFPDAKLNIGIEDGMVTIKTDKFARCVELIGDCDGDEFGWFFEDNYFDLFPWEEKKVRILGSHKRGIIKAKAHFSTYVPSVELK